MPQQHFQILRARLRKICAALDDAGVPASFAPKLRQSASSLRVNHGALFLDADAAGKRQRGDGQGGKRSVPGHQSFCSSSWRATSR